MRRLETAFKPRARRARNMGMARTTDKRNLPSKDCPVCGRPFSWRKKWAVDWEDVIYCSDRCRREARRRRRLQ